MTLAKNLKIPFINTSFDKDSYIRRAVLSAVEEVMDSGNYIIGHHLENFEERLAGYCVTSYAIGLNSGTDALLMVMKALEIGPGDEVIVPGNVFHAVGNAVCLTGATPVFIDVNYDDMLLNTELLEGLTTERTKAVIPVHLTGMPCDMDEILDFADAKGLYVIEDAAQALGAEYKGRKAGSMGTAGCFSFHPLKNIHAIGDGGAVVTNDETLRDRLLHLRNHGMNEGRFAFPGYNSRLDEIHAATLNIQLDYLDEITEQKNRIASFYTKNLFGNVGVNIYPEYKKGAFQLYMIKTKKRNELAQFLNEQGIGTGIHYAAYYPFYDWYLKKGLGAESLPETLRLSEEVLSLPVHLRIDEEELEYIVKQTGLFFSKQSSYMAAENE